MAIPAELLALFDPSALPSRAERDPVQDPRWSKLNDAFDQAGSKPWNQILQLSTELLTEVAWDTRLLNFASQSLFHLHGYPGLALGMSRWVHILEAAWDLVGPKKLAQREGGLKRYVSAAETWIAGFPPAPSVDQELLQRCLHDIGRMQALLGEREIEDVSNLGVAQEILEIALERKRLEVSPVQPAASTPSQPEKPVQAHNSTQTQQTASAAEPTASQAAVSKPASQSSAVAQDAQSTSSQSNPESASTQARAAAGSTTPQGTAGAAVNPRLPDDASPSQIRDAFDAQRAAVLTLLERLQRLDPSSPNPYRIGRDWAWGILPPSVTRASPNARTVIAAPPAGTVAKVHRLLDLKDWSELLATCEKAWPRALFCVDLQWGSATALRGLGHHEAALAVESSVGLLLRRLPALETLQYDDGSPFASDGARAWLTTLGAEDQPQQAPPGPVAGRAAAEDASPGEPTPEDSSEQLLSRCASALRAGRAREAALLLAEQLLTLGPGREHFRLRLRFAGVLLEHKQARAAAPLLVELDEEAQQRDLAHWEPSLAAELMSCMVRSAAPPARPGAASPELELLRRRAARVGALHLLFDETRSP